MTDSQDIRFKGVGTFTKRGLEYVQVEKPATLVIDLDSGHVRIYEGAVNDVVEAQPMMEINSPDAKDVPTEAEVFALQEWSAKQPKKN